MIHSPRPLDGPLPGDLYLDSAVPEWERMTMTGNGWTAQVTHVWTGTGWSRLTPGTVRAVPTHPPVPAVSSTPSVSSARAATGEGMPRWRQRKLGRGGAAQGSGRRRG